MKVWKIWLPGVVVLALVGCAEKRRLPADAYFAQATNYFREGAYPAAVEQYRELLDQYPFSEHSEEAELRIAHAHYLNDACPEAVAAFTDFQRRHPTSPNLAFAGYLIGQCYERQMRPEDRDQSASQNAHAYYVAVIQQYPDSPFADLARMQMNRCRERIAQHEFSVANFYAHRGNEKAAEYRLLDLVNRFNDTDTAGDALYALGELYRQQGSDDHAALAFAAVVRDHPKNSVAEAARTACAELGDGHVLVGDPLALLKAETGRSRALALAQVVEVPPLERSMPHAGFGAGAMPSGMSGRTGPFAR